MSIPDAVLEELRRLEHSLWIAETRFNRSLMDRIFANDFFEFGRSGGRFTRDECLDVEPKQHIEVTLPLAEFAVRQLDESNFLVTYVSIHTGAAQGRANRASLWTITAEGWKLRFHQGTPAA